MKSQKRIELLVKILWILSIIIFVCCCVGAVGCVIGLAVFGAIQGLDLGGKTLPQYLLENGINVNTAYTAMAIGLWTCAYTGFAAMYVGMFFKRQSDKGIVYDYPTVKELRKVALVDIIINFVGATIAAIGAGIAHSFDKTINVKIGGIAFLAFAICLLVVSLFVEYIAEKEASEKPAVEAEPAEEVEKKEE